MKSKSVSVNVTANGLAANKAQQTANQAVASAAKYKTAWEEANSENLEALSTAQREFESNLAWAKSQIYEGKHQNDSAVASLQSDMESSWNSMSTVEESLYNSASTATSEADSRLESLRVQNNQSMADLHSAADSLHAAANSLHADADSMRSSLMAATSEIGNDLANARNSLAAVDSDLRNGIKRAGADLANAKTSLTATGNSLANRAVSLATATSELQRQTGQISGSLSTADSMIMYNSNAIAEVKRTAGEISSTVSNIRVGDRNIARGNAGGKDWFSFTGFNGTTNQYVDLVSYSLSTLKAGDKVTFGITMKNEGITSGTMFFQQHGDVSEWNRDYGAISPGGNVTDFVPNGAEKALTYTITITSGMLDGNSSYILQVRTDNVPAGGKLSFRYGFVKKGTMATDWTPAPEDTDQAISKISQTADTIRADLANTKGDVASVKAKADSLTSSIANAQGQISTLQQRADSLTSTLSNGGRNLLSNTREINDSSLWENLWAWKKGDFYNDGINKCQIVQNSDQQWSGLNQYVFVEEGKKYTYSIDAKSGDTSNHTAWFFCNIYDVPGSQNNKSSSMIGSGQVLHYTPTWTRYSFTVTAPKNGYACPSIVRGTTTNELLQLARPQFEYGDTATPWQPSNGDISSLQQTASSLTSRISNAEGDVSGLQQTAKSIQASVADNKNNISSVKQTATELQSDLSNAKGDVSSLQQTANKLTSDMADAKGNISSLQQTATGLQSTVQGQSGKISQLQQDADGLSATVGGAAVDVIPNLDQQFVMGYGIDNTVWQDGNAYIKLPTTRKAGEVLPQTAGFTLNIPLQAGKTYMQSIIFETDATINDSIQPQWTWFMNSHDPRNATLSKLGDNTYRLIGAYTPTQAKANSAWLRIFDIPNFTDVVDVTTGTYLKFRNPRIWCPDDNSLAQLKLTADGLTSKVADTQGNVSNLQLTAKDLQTKIANANGDISNVKQTADSVKADLTNAKNDIASVKLKADSLTSSMANANDQISTLQQRADSLTSTLSNGGRNLLSNTREINDPSIWSNLTLWDKGDFYHDGGNDCQIVQTNTQQWLGLKQYIEVQAGRKYTFSIDAKSGDNSNHTAGFYASLGAAQEGPYNKAEVIGDGQTLNYTPTWARYSFTITATTNGYVAPRIERGTTTNELLQLARPQFEYGDTATPWKPSNGDISSLQQTASQLTSDIKDAKGNISTLQQTAGGLTSRVGNAEENVSSLQQTAKELDAQIKSVDGKATTIKTTADGISARVSGIENNKVVGSLLKVTDSEAGLGNYINGKLIAGINTNANGDVLIDGDVVHIHGSTHIDDGVINANKITVYNTVGDNKGNQYLAVAWGQLNSTIGGKDDQGNTLWGSINQTKDKFSSYYTRSDVDNKLSQQSSLISQTAENITAIVNDAKNFATYTVSSSNTWNFDYTKSIYGNWFLNGDTSTRYIQNGPKNNSLAPYMYVTSRGPEDGSRFVVTVWKDNDPTQYQRVWSENKWSEWVMLPNSQNLISAINLSPDSVKINGKNIELNGNTKVTGRLDLMQDRVNWVNQSTNYHNNWSWNNAHIYFDNYLQLLGENCNVHYTNTNTTLNGGNTFYSITTLTPGYLKFTTYNHKVYETDENFDGQITRSYLDSGRLETPEVYTDKFVITGHHIRVRDNQFLMVTNKNGTNFDGNGSVGFQVWGGIVLGQNTIGAPSNELYFQRGNIDAILGQRYSDAPKLTLHAQKVISQEANSVSSRLSVKTAITKVTYNRALMAVQNTDMYDYKYINDDSSQHYVSGIIDDIHDKPEYNMDPMLINQERTARIDANLLGYHHVVLQEILKRLDKLEAK